MGDRLATIDMGRKEEELLCPLWGDCSPSDSVAWAEVYLRRTKWHLDQSIHSSRLATADMGPKLGLCSFFLGGGAACLHLTQCGRDRGLPTYQVAS